jgi:ankyrin repeat protein
MDMLVSSIHPATAGVQVALVETLLEFGAAIDGVRGDGSPLLTALAFHYPDAAAALAGRGARVNNIITAAGLGREDLVRSFVDRAGNLKADVPLATTRWPRLPAEPTAHMERALILASALGRLTIVDFLSQKGVDLSAKDEQGFTALHWASFRGHLHVVDLLLERHAPLESRSKYGGTVLDGTVWASIHGGLAVDYVPIVQRLIAAGARIDAVHPFPTGNKPVDELLAHHGQQRQ